MKARETAIRQSEERYRMLFDSMDESYCVIEVLFDPPGSDHAVDYRFLEVNAAFVKVTGWTDVVGKRMRDIAPDHEEYWFAMYGGVAVTGEPIRFERQAGALSGRWFDLYAFRLAEGGEGGDSKSRKVAVLFTDVTDRKKAEQRLRQAKEDAESASHAKDRFLAILSHELRTLTPVVMSVAAMELDPTLPPDVRESAKMIRRNVELEVKLIDDLLDLSRITSGKLRLQADSIDINDLVRHVCEMSQSSLRQKGVRLHRDLDQNAGRVVGDSARLHQVFWNLLSNATKFTPECGHIDVTTQNIGDSVVRITVRDTGIGIPDEVLPNVFNAFEQGDARITRQFGGLGLGLAISKRLIEAHQGSIRAETGGLNRGSAFIVELPSVPTAVRAGRSAEAVPNPKKETSALRVLVVEDDEDTAKVLGLLLKSSGHDVRTAGTATIALALVSEHPFDIMVSDIGLPDMPGYELMKRVKEKHGLIGICMSGYGMEEDIRKSVDAGFAEHLVKPVSFRLLQQAIHRVVDN